MNISEDLISEDLIDESKVEAEEPPPVGGKWKNLYLVVLLALAIQIILYYLITNHFS